MTFGAGDVTIEPNDAARARESGRLTSSLVLGGFVLASAIAAASAPLPIGARVGVPVVFGLIVAALLVPMVAGSFPSVLTQQPNLVGSWSATVAGGDIREHMNFARFHRPQSELMGRVVATPDEVNWLPNAPSTRNLGAEPVTWGPEWRRYTRRLRGRGLAQLCLVGPDGRMVDFWLRDARDI